MGQMALIILGLFVLVWIISAVVKASQDTGPKSRPGGNSNRQRQQSDSPRVERTSETDIDRFMAEIDRLRRKGEGAPAGRPPEQARPQPRQDQRPSSRGEPRPRPQGERRDRDRERERRPRQSQRPAPPPPLPSESIPVLRPVAPPESPKAPPPPPPPPAKPAKPARPAAAQVKVAPPSAVLQTLQSVLKTKDGRAAALILAEIFGDPRGRTGTVRQPHRFTNG
jgi:hypothetical protein